MTDTVRSCIEERRVIHSKGTDVLLRNAYELDREAELWGEDAEAIADAHNMFPRALDALNAVLEVLDAGVRDGDDAEIMRNIALSEIAEALEEVTM